MRRENIESKRNMGPEDIVVRAVVNYFDTPRFKRFSIEKEYPIQIGSYRMRADVALIDKAKPPAAIVECKRSSYEGDGQDQLESYLNVTGTQLGVFANETDPTLGDFIKIGGKVISMRLTVPDLSRSLTEMLLRGWGVFCNRFCRTLPNRTSRLTLHQLTPTHLTSSIYREPPLCKTIIIQILIQV